MHLHFTPGQTAAQADSALKHAIATEEKARKCAVLWFAEILERKLYRQLGRSSMQQYARLDLGFSETRTSDFMHLARKLDRLPAVKAALPDIGYTKAREIVKVASPRTESTWVKRAKKNNRRDLAEQVKRVINKARRPAATLFDGPRSTPGAAKEGVPVSAKEAAVLAAEVPVRISLEFTPEQFARWETLLADLAKRGVTGDRAQILLDALAALVADDTGEKPNDATSTKSTDSTDTARRRAVPPAQVHVHHCPQCRKTEIGGRPISRADRERIACDAAVSHPGQRNSTTIPPRTRRQVLARDRHQCTAPGCHRTQFLEVHHIVPRSRGGSNEAGNLATLCGSCHRLVHENRLNPTDSMG